MTAVSAVMGVVCCPGDASTAVLQYEMIDVRPRIAAF